MKKGILIIVVLITGWSSKGYAQTVRKPNTTDSIVMQSNEVNVTSPRNYDPKIQRKIERRRMRWIHEAEDSRSRNPNRIAEFPTEFTPPPAVGNR